MVLIRHALSLPLKTFNVAFCERLAKLVEAFANHAGLVTERYKERDIHFLLVLQKIFGAFQRLRILPLQRRANCDIRIEEAGLGNHRVDSKQSAQRMARKNAIRLNSILLLDLGNEFSLEELQKIVGAAGC